MKRQVVTEKVEVIKQVKLTSRQRLALIEMQNKGGLASHLDWAVRIELSALGLIEERLRCTPGEVKNITKLIEELWKQVPAALKERDEQTLDRLADDIRGKKRELTLQAWWLTEAANEYLTNGKVTITR